jgi:DNA-binding beta-propeller fold protein YncE
MRGVFLILALSGGVQALADEVLVWPAPPETARYRYVGALHGARDVLPRPGFWARLATFVSGERAEHVLIRPYGVAVSADGTLAVADPGLPGVHLFQRERREYRLIRPEGDGTLTNPVAVAFTATGTVLVADSGTASVLEFSRNGSLLRRIGQGRFKRPTGIAVHGRDGRIFVADALAHCIMVFNAKGEWQRTIGARGDAPGAFNFPTHLALDREGLLYVTDSLNFRIQVLDDSGAPLRQFGRLGDRLGDLSKPKGVAVGEDGRIYVVEGYFDHLLVFDRDGRLLLPVGGGGASPGRFNLPAGVAVHDDLIYVADSYNRRVQIFRALSAAPAP